MPARPNESVGRDLGGACILVIDDEEGVRRIVRRMLAESGCRVVEATDGYEGLVAVEHEASIDLVLTDLSMPRVGGLAVIEVLGRRRPDLPIVAMSGDGAAMRAAPRIPFVRKPFTADELVRLLADLLSRGRHAAPDPGYSAPGRSPDVLRLQPRARYRAPPR